MNAQQQIEAAIARLVKPSLKGSMRETLEAHADKICSDHNRVMQAMVHFLDTGKVQIPQIRAWAQEVAADRNKDVSAMKLALTSALLAPPKFEGLSDDKALEVYGRLLVNLFALEVLGQPAMA